MAAELETFVASRVLVGAARENGEYIYCLVPHPILGPSPHFGMDARAKRGVITIVQIKSMIPCFRIAYLNILKIYLQYVNDEQFVK